VDGVRKVDLWTGRYRLATLNNESLELNRYRIEQFRLRETFSDFFSSCFLGVRKPDHAIYQRALQITQRQPAHCLFIDDRALNLECAQRLGFHTIHHQTVAQLQKELKQEGVDVD
ncbi:MAG: HAD-IA family hydrolase, partial [Terriglobia bacterium]